MSPHSCSRREDGGETGDRIVTEAQTKHDLSHYHLEGREKLVTYQWRGSPHLWFHSQHPILSSGPFSPCSNTCSAVPGSTFPSLISLLGGHRFNTLFIKYGLYLTHLMTYSSLKCALLPSNYFCPSVHPYSVSTYTWVLTHSKSWPRGALFFVCSDLVPFLSERYNLHKAWECM